MGREAERQPDCRTVVLDRDAPTAVARAAARVLAGGVIAFPTDTVYGVAASLARPEALRRIYTVKGRPEEKPLPVLLASAVDLAQVAPELDERVARFAAQFWPGPLTVVVPARTGLPPEVLGPDHTVGVRVPDLPLALELIRGAGGALATTSANRSGEPPARNAGEVVRQLGDRLDLILDGGPTPGGVPSSVVAVRGGELVVLRDGALPAETLRRAWLAR